jgi:hypothetical protein
MARVVLLLLLVAAATLVVALFFDFRGQRSDSRLAHLRSAFLHGSPLGGYSKPSQLREMVAFGGVLRLRVPGTWEEERQADAQVILRLDLAASRSLRLELRTLEYPGVVTVESLAQALGALKPEKERCLEVLPNGTVLMKSLEAIRGGGEARAGFQWHLGSPLPPHRARVAVFTLTVEFARAADVVAQSDVATLEREIRSAVLSSDAGSSA